MERLSNDDSILALRVVLVFVTPLVLGWDSADTMGLVSSQD